MAYRWLELSKVSEKLNLELDYLYDIVSGNSIKPDTKDNQFNDEVSCSSDVFDNPSLSNNNDIASLKQELATIKIESAWLKSENMKNSKVLHDYYNKFTQLKRIQKELIDIINQQAETIRLLQGHKPGKYKENLNFNESKSYFHSGFSIWVFIPIIGLILTAALEVVRINHNELVKSIMNFLGL